MKQKRNPLSNMADGDPVFKAGRQQGLEDCRMKVFGFLEDRYIKDPNRPDKDSPQGKAILQLARELSAFLVDHAK